MLFFRLHSFIVIKLSCTVKKGVFINAFMLSYYILFTNWLNNIIKFLYVR